MTVVGKILVFLNLVFSLLVGGLVILSYSNRELWVDRFNEQKNEAAAFRASRDQIYKDKLAAEGQLKNEIQALQATIGGLNTKLDNAAKEVAMKDAQLTEYKKSVDKTDAGTRSTIAAGSSREEEVRGLEKALTDARTQNRDLQKAFREERADKVRAEIEAKTTKARLIQMEEEIQRLARQLAKRATAGTTTTAATGDRSDAKNPPPEDLEGRVVSIDADSGLISIRPGSDSGLLRGHTLEVFRLGSSPKYLGRIRVEAVRPHEAVARPVKKSAVPIRVGDRVASRIQIGR